MNNHGFKIGDEVIVSSPSSGYNRYKDKTGTICAISNTVRIPFYYVNIENGNLAAGPFMHIELQLAKNHIVINILKDL